MQNYAKKSAMEQVLLGIPLMILKQEILLKLSGIWIRQNRGLILLLIKSIRQQNSIYDDAFGKHFVAMLEVFVKFFFDCFEKFFRIRVYMQ